MTIQEKRNMLKAEIDQIENELLIDELQAIIYGFANGHNGDLEIYTKEALLSRTQASLKDIKDGQVLTVEELKTDFESW